MFIKDRITSKEVDVKWCPSDDMVADFYKGVAGEVLRIQVEDPELISDGRCQCIWFTGVCLINCGRFYTYSPISVFFCPIFNPHLNCDISIVFIDLGQFSRIDPTRNHSLNITKWIFVTNMILTTSIIESELVIHKIIFKLSSLPTRLQTTNHYL